MTASAAAAGLPLFPLTVLVLWTTFGAVQQTACMPVQPPPSPVHGDGTVQPWYPNMQPNSTAKVDEVDKDPATATPLRSRDVGVSTLLVSGGTHTTGRLPTTTTQAIPGSTTKDGVSSTSTRETTALPSTTGMDVTADGTGRPKIATTTVTPPPERTGIEQGPDAKVTTPASKGTEATSVSEVSERGEGRSGKALVHSWQGDDSSVFERATEQQQMSKNGGSYQATTTDAPAQQTETKPDTTPLHTTSMKMKTTDKPGESSSHQEESTQPPSDPETAPSQSTTADPTSTTINSLSTTVVSTTTQSQSTQMHTTTTKSPSTAVDLTTTQSPNTTADPASLHQTQVTPRMGQNSKDQEATDPRKQGVPVSSQTTQTAAETTTLRPTVKVTQKHDILQPALPAHTDEREQVATIGTNQELPQGWQRDGSSGQDSGRSKNVEETAQSGDKEENTTAPAILTTEPVNMQEYNKTSKQTPTMAQTISVQTTTAMPDGTEQSTQKIQPTTPRSEQIIVLDNDQGVTQRPDKDQHWSTTSQTTVANDISREDRTTTEQSAEIEQKLTTPDPAKPAEDEHQLTTSLFVQPSSAEASTITQNENLQTVQHQTNFNNGARESSPTTTLTADTQSKTTTSTAKATTETMPTELPRYLEAEVLTPEEVTVQERQDQEENLDQDEQPTVSSSQEGGDDSWQQHVEVMVHADVQCEEVPDGVAELPLFADSGRHMKASAEDVSQGSGDRSVQSESKETSEEISEDTDGQQGMDESTVSTTVAISDEAIERILSEDFLQDEGENAKAMSLFTDSEAEQTGEEKTKEPKQEEGRKVPEELTEKASQVMELVTESANQDRETTAPVTQSPNGERGTTEYVTQPSNQDRETTTVYKPPIIVTYGPFDPLVADEESEGILPTDLTVPSKDEKGSESDRKDSMSANLPETTIQTTTGVATTDERIGTELTSAAPSRETTATANTLFTEEEEQEVISFVSTMPMSTTTIVAKTTSTSKAMTSDTSTAEETTTSTVTVNPTSSTGATTKMSKPSIIPTTERPVTLTPTDRQATTTQDPLDFEMFTAETDLAAHMIGKITANQEGDKDGNDASEDEQLSSPAPTTEDMLGRLFSTELPDEANVESSTVDTTLSSTLSQTTESDFLSTRKPLPKKDGTTVPNTSVESTEQPKASEKLSSETVTQATPRVENTTSMVASAKNMQDLTTERAKSLSSETKSSTKIPSSIKTVTMSPSVEKTTADTGVKEVLPTRNAPALRDIITVRLSKTVEVVTEPTVASTEQTTTTTRKSAPGTSTLDAHMTTFSPGVAGQKLMGSTDEPKVMTTTRGMDTTVQPASTEQTTTISRTSAEIASEGINNKEEEGSLNVDGSIDTSNETDNMLITPSHVTSATVQPTSAASSEKGMKTTESDISSASQHDVKVTTMLPKTSTVQPALVTSPKVPVRQNTTSAETTKDASVPVASTKTTATQKVEEPRRLPAIITVLTAQPPVTTEESGFSTKVWIPESTELTSTSVVTERAPQMTVESTTFKTEAEREKNAGKMTETTPEPVKPTEARIKGTTTTEPTDSTTEGTVSQSTSDVVTSTAVTEVSTASDDVEILEVDQSATGGETAGSLYLDNGNEVIPFQKQGEDGEKETPLGTTSKLPTEEMDAHTEKMKKLTTEITPKPTEPVKSSPVTFGGSDQQQNILSSTEQHTAEKTTKTATTTTAKFSITKQSESEPTTTTTTTTQKNIQSNSSTNIVTTVIPTSLPTTLTGADKTQQTVSPSTAALTTTIMTDRKLETSTRVQEKPSSAKVVPVTERYLPAVVISVLTMRPVTTTPVTTTIQPNEATKNGSATTSTRLSSTELKNGTAEQVLSASTPARPQTTEKTISTKAMLTPESPLYRTTTIPQTDVTDKTDDRTPTDQLPIISSDQSPAGKEAGSLHEGQPSENMDMSPTTEQTKGKDAHVSSTTVTPSSATETSTKLFPTTQGKKTSTLKTTELSTTQGTPSTTNGSTSGSKKVEGEVTDKQTRQTVETTKSPEARTLSNPATTSLFVSNKESDTLQETEEVLTANTIVESEGGTTTTEPSITQTLRSSTPTVPRETPVRNAAAIITVLTARPPRVQASFAKTTSSATTSTVAPVEIVEGTTKEHTPKSVVTTEMVQTSTGAVQDKTNTPAQDTATALSRSTESVTKSGLLSVTEKMLQKDLTTTQETATTSEMPSDISEKPTVTLAQSASTGETTGSTMLNTKPTRKLSPGSETATTPLLQETTSVLPTTQSAENAQMANTESEVENGQATSQASDKAAPNGTVVISETTTLATTTPKTTTHIGNSMVNTDKTATTSSASTVAAAKKTERMVATKDAASKKMSRTTQAPKTTKAETTVQPTETARGTSTKMMDTKTREESSTPRVDTTTVTTKPESEAPQDTKTRMSTPKPQSTEKMVATTALGIEPTTRGAQETTTLPGSGPVQVIDLEDEAGTTEWMGDGRVPL
ncbi:uncharacterized protein LOC144917700 [Branchiostoma floridae x Branchiostoma belcheri]